MHGQAREDSRARAWILLVIRNLLVLAFVPGILVLAVKTSRDYSRSRVTMKQKRTMSAIHVTASAMENFLDDHPGWTGATGGQFLLPAEVRGLLVGEYLSEKGWEEARRDAWNRPLLVWVLDDRLAVISFGSDGEPDEDYRSMTDLHKEIPQSAPSDDPSVDIIHLGELSGFFLFYQWPRGLPP
jgi:hypothetical protein